MGWSGRSTVEDGRGRDHRPHARRARALALVAAVVGVVMAAVVGVAIAGSGPAAADDVTVTIEPTGLAPASVAVAPGTAITWVNAAGADRFVAADDGTFDSGRLGPNETFQFVFTTERTLSYHVTGQPGQSGTIVVRAGASTTAPVAGAGSPFAQSPTPPAAVPDPNLATTGSAESFNSVAGALLLAGGVGLTIWAARRRLSLAWIGSPFGRHDDLLPRGERRVSRERGHAPRRSRHRV